MKFLVPILCEIPLEQLREYLNEETLRQISAGNREVKVTFEKVLNISITVGETPDGKDLVSVGGMETGDA